MARRKFFGFASGEIGRDHGDPQQLFLKKRNAERALQHWLERWVRIGDFFASLAAQDEGIHHLAHDWPGADDRDLHDDVVEAFWKQARQRRHLRAAFHLEQSHRVGLLQRGIHLRIVRRKVRQIDLFVIVVADEFDGIFEHGHHAEAEQIDFDDAHVGAIFFVPLHDDAAGHGGGFERDDGIELSLADDHAAGVLAEMARHVLHGDAEFVIFAQARMVEVESGIAKAAVEGIVFVAEFPGGDGRGNFLERFRIEAQSLAHFARGHAIAIGDDVGGHGGAACAVTLIDILNDFFALVAAGQVEIDVGPLAALFGKKSLEEQFHADGIDRRDAERVADGAVGGGSAPLHQNVLLAAVADQVPDDEKVSGEFEFLDESQFFLNLAARAGLHVMGSAAVALAEPFPGALAQEGIHGLALGHGIAREFVAEIVEREFQARGKFAACWRWLRAGRRRVPAFPAEISESARRCGPAGVPR